MGPMGWLNCSLVVRGSSQGGTVLFFFFLVGTEGNRTDWNRRQNCYLGIAPCNGSIQQTMSQLWNDCIKREKSIWIALVGQISPWSAIIDISRWNPKQISTKSKLENGNSVLHFWRLLCSSNCLKTMLLFQFRNDYRKEMLDVYTMSSGVERADKEKCFFLSQSPRLQEHPMKLMGRWFRMDKSKFYSTQRVIGWQWMPWWPQE